MGESQGERAEHREVHYERRDVNAFYLMGIGLLIIVAAVVIHVAVGVLYKYLNDHDERRGQLPVSLLDRGRQPPPEPRLQIDPAADLRQMRMEENGKLHTYGWIDRQTGAVRIPIEQAMKLLAARGLPPASQPSANTSPAGQTAAPPTTAAPGRTNSGKAGERRSR